MAVSCRLLVYWLWLGSTSCVARQVLPERNTTPLSRTERYDVNNTSLLDTITEYDYDIPTVTSGNGSDTTPHSQTTLPEHSFEDQLNIINEHKPTEEPFYSSTEGSVSSQNLTWQDFDTHSRLTTRDEASDHQNQEEEKELDLPEMQVERKQEDTKITETQESAEKIPDITESGNVQENNHNQTGRELADQFDLTTVRTAMIDVTTDVITDAPSTWRPADAEESIERTGNINRTFNDKDSSPWKSCEMSTGTERTDESQDEEDVADTVRQGVQGNCSWATTEEPPQNVSLSEMSMSEERGEKNSSTARSMNVRGRLGAGTAMRVRAAFSIMTVIVCTVGIVLNIPSSVVFWKMISSTSNSYMSHLLVLDTICLIIALPVTLVQMFYGSQGSVPSAFVYFRLYFALTSMIGLHHAIYVITSVMSLDRCLALVLPLKALSKNPLRHPKVITATVTAFVLIFTITDMATRLRVTELADARTNTTMYVIQPTNSFKANTQLYSMVFLFSSILLRFVPVFAILVSNMALFLALLCHFRKMRDAGISNHAIIQRDMKLMKSVKAVVVYSLVFLLLGLPFTCFQIVDFVFPELMMSEPFLTEIISVLFPFFDMLSSGSDFFVFFAVNAAFREGFKALVFKAGCRRG